MSVGAPDKSPPLASIVRSGDLARTLRPLLAWDLDLIALYDRHGAAFLCVTPEGGQLHAWEQLPPEAAMHRHGRGVFGLGDHLYEVRTVYAGADRAGVLVIGVPAERMDEATLSLRGEAIHAVVSSLLQAGFASWVTSELHLATSQSAHAALEANNAELQRAVEHLKGLDTLKSNFLATVSHELRTPLTSIIGFAELLLQGIAGDLNPDQAEHVQTILERGEELYRLITQILEMSRVEAGSMRLNLAPHTLAAMAQRAFAACEIAARAQDVTLRFEDFPAANEAEGTSPPIALADGDRIQQVLVNLVSNAIKFHGDNAPEVVISGALAPIRRPFDEEDFFGAEDEDALKITVRDNGVGIPEDQLERIFEAFYQVDSSATREHGGAGLGLSIVRKLVQAHGGEIWAESEVGQGTAIHFTLPLARMLVEERGVNSQPQASAEA